MIFLRLVVCLTGFLCIFGSGRCSDPRSGTCLMTIDAVHFFDINNVTEDDVAKVLVGRAFWCIFHLTSTLYTNIGSLPPRYKKALEDTLEILPLFFPCSVCRHHMKRLFKNKKPTLESPEKYARWLADAHDSVSARLGKKTYGICHWYVNFSDIRSLFIRSHIIILTVIAFNYTPEDVVAVEATKKYIGLVPRLIPFQDDYEAICDIFLKNPAQFESQESFKKWMRDVTFSLSKELMKIDRRVYNCEL